MARTVRRAVRSSDHFRYYVVRGSKYLVGHLLDFRKGQMETEFPNGSPEKAETGVTELPVELYTAGGFTAPLPDGVETLVEVESN